MNRLAELNLSYIYTRVLGVAPTVEPDISLPNIPANCRLLLCTEGLTAQVNDITIGEILGLDCNPDRTARELVLEADSTGGADNVAVIVVDLS